MGSQRGTRAKLEAFRGLQRPGRWPLAVVSPY